jgi:hypothetical protein
MSASALLGANGKISAAFLPSGLTSTNVPEGLAAKIEALEEFARLVAEVVAIQLEDGTTYQYTGVPQGIVPVPVLTMAEVAKEPEDPSVEEASKK